MTQLDPISGRNGTSARPSRRTLLLGLPALALAGCSEARGTVLPEGPLQGLPGLVDAARRPVPGFAADEFRRGPALLNIWASWCPECRSEHEQLMRLAGDKRLRLLGLVFRDGPEAAASYLRRAGNPYAAVAQDDGRIAKLLGQKGVPYSYVLDGRGRVVALVRGALDDQTVRDIVMPALAEAGRSA